MSFHDEKVWQEGYVAVLDLLEITDRLAQNDIVDQIRKHAMMVVTVTSQAVSHQDRKMRDIKLRDTRSIIIAMRSLLSILWAQEVLSDEEFGKVDAAFESYANTLPR